MLIIYPVFINGKKLHCLQQKKDKQSESNVINEEPFQSILFSWRNGEAGFDTSYRKLLKRVNKNGI